jgi:hypothetical protein
VADGSIITRPPLHGERRYLYSSARAFTAARYGEKYVDYGIMLALVDEILDRCELTVALFDGVLDDRGRPEIHGFTCIDPRDATVEFFHLRRLYRELSTSALAGRVARALLGERDTVVLRRGPSREALTAIVAASIVPVVRPRSV